jgi:hypothetical protein
VRFGIDCDWKGKIVRFVGGGPVAIHSTGQSAFSFSHIQSIILGAGEVAGGANGMGMNR